MVTLAENVFAEREWRALRAAASHPPPLPVSSFQLDISIPPHPKFNV